MGTESVSTRARNVVVAFLCLSGLLTLATAGVQKVAPASAAVAVSGWVPPLHEAEAGADVGPGSDEGWLVSSPGTNPGR